MSLALMGNTGLFTGVDYRGNQVVAAFGGIHSTPLGMIVKKDSAEVYSPIRGQLNWSIPLLFALVGVGAYVLRQKISPIARRLLDSECRATENEHHIRTVVEGVGEAIITIDDAGVIQSFNQAATVIFGHAVDDIVGKSITLLMPDAMRKSHEKGLARYLSTGEQRVIGKKGVELPGLRKDGSTFDLELAVSEIQAAGRRYFVGIIRDITARKIAEEMLFTEKETLRVTLGSIGDGVITTGLTGAVTYLNPVAEEMTGWKNAEAIGQPFTVVFKIVNGGTRQAALDPVSVVLRDEKMAGLDEAATRQEHDPG